MFCGVRPAQEHRCFEVGNTDISTPISEITPIEAKVWIPCTVVTRTLELSRGIFAEICEKLKAAGAMEHITFHEEYLKLILDDMTEAAGVGAHIAVKDGCTPKQADIGKIQKILLDNGAFIG